MMGLKEIGRMKNANFKPCSASIRKTDSTVTSIEGFHYLR